MASRPRPQHYFALFIVVITVASYLYIRQTSISQSIRPSSDQLKGGSTTNTRPSNSIAILKYRPTSGSELKSYMLSLNYAEQLGNAVSHYVRFINLVAGWNLTGVEPYFYNSRLFGLRYIRPTTSLFKCSLLLNTSSLNTELSSCLERANDAEKGSPILFEPLSEFLSRSQRYIVTVYFTKHMPVFSREIHKAMDSSVNFGDKPICDCTNTARDKGMSQQVEKLLDQELVLERTSNPDWLPQSKANFTVVQAFCVNKSTPISLVQLRDYVLSHIGHDDDGNKLQVSILFISWQGRFTHTFTDPITMNKCKTQLVYSDKVLDTANQFIHSLDLHESSYVSVHIRFGHVFKDRKSDPEAVYQCCMRKLNVLLSMVQQKYNITSKRTLLMKDFGHYGSDACLYEGSFREVSICTSKSSELLSLLNVTLAEFDPVAFDAPVNSGFVSLVEASSLFSGRALITIGGGTYQGYLVRHFLKQHQDPHNPNAANKLHYHLACERSTAQQKVNELVFPDNICA